MIEQSLSYAINENGRYEHTKLQCEFHLTEIKKFWAQNLSNLQVTKQTYIKTIKYITNWKDLYY